MLDEKTIKAIESVLAKDQRVELIPSKGEVVVLQIERKTVKK